MPLLLLLLLQSALAEPKPTDNHVPSAEVVAALEAKLQPPPGAGPLTAYTRWYTAVKLARRETILGQMAMNELAATDAKIRHQSPPAPVNRVLEKDLPVGFDGGCTFVNVIYDVQAQAPPKVFCNPVR